MSQLALSRKELELGVPAESSWHQDYAHSSFIYVGNLHEGLTEGDLVIVFSQFGVPTFVKIIRDKFGKSKGFAFIEFEDQRSTILAVDNLDGSRLLGRTLKVDHTNPKEKDDVPLSVLYNETER